MLEQFCLSFLIQVCSARGSNLHDHEVTALPIKLPVTWNSAIRSYEPKDGLELSYYLNSIVQNWNLILLNNFVLAVTWERWQTWIDRCYDVTNTSIMLALYTPETNFINWQDSLCQSKLKSAKLILLSNVSVISYLLRTTNLIFYNIIYVFVAIVVIRNISHVEMQRTMHSRFPVCKWRLNTFVLTSILYHP